MAKSPARRRSRSRSRSQSRVKKRSSSKSTRSRSRSRSRSRGRERTPKPKTKSSRSHSATPTRTKIMRAETPTRASARIAAQSSPSQEKTNAIKTPEPLPDDRTRGVNRTTHTEFGGPTGAFFMILGLPLVMFGINLACWKGECSTSQIPKIPMNWQSYFDLQAAQIVLGWYAFLSVLYMLPIGRVVKGQPISTQKGKRLRYRCNGFFAFVVSLIGFGAAVYLKVPVTIIYTKFLQLMTTAAIFAFIMSVFLYIKARRGQKNLLAPGGNTGNFVYDFFIGHELNPRIGEYDFKFFCELRPGLIGWVLINLSFLVKRYEETGTVDHSIALVAAMQALYVADALWFEDAILTTMDITTDGFGFMLAFGDLAWVPFLYCLQARYLTENPLPLPWYCLAGIALLNFIGYYIFRGSNSQKNDFRNNPHDPRLAHLETIPTQTGKRLLVSGWWGLCHKPNYLGDIIMSIAWSLPCGFHSVLPYFYPVYFTILLIHRERRDNAHCQKKYKASWDRFCEKVKYRIFPRIY